MSTAIARSGAKSQALVVVPMAPKTAHQMAADILAQAGLLYDHSLVLQTAHVALLAAASTGRLDLNQLAREELANRGVDHTGCWVGFDRARELINA